MSDPLSLLAGSDFSDSEDEVDKEHGEAGVEETHDQASSYSKNKLPSPSTLFATVGKPAFLNDPQAKKIDWDGFVRNDVDTDTYSIHITDDGGYAAIPPPQEDSTDKKPVYNSLSAAIKGTYNKDAAGQISAAPVRYTQPEQVDPKYRSVDSGYEELKTGTKRPTETDQTDINRKKSKTETFRQKEKRKRDLGQSSRGKSYVEEEKRLLRQHFATDEVMS